MANTYKELRDAVLGYLQVAIAGTPSEADYIRNGTDLILLAVNNAMRTAQRRHDFNFLYDLVEVTVDPVSGGKWTNVTPTTQLFPAPTSEWHIMPGALAIELWTVNYPDIDPRTVTQLRVVSGTHQGTYAVLGYNEVHDALVFKGYATPYDNVDTVDLEFTYTTKTLRKIQGMFLPSGDAMMPIPWDSQRNAASQRLREHDVSSVSYSRDLDRVYGGSGEVLNSSLRGEVVSDTIFLQPIQDQAQVINVSGFKWIDDITGLTDTNFFIEHGFEWLMWQMIIELNHLSKQFVFRQEGNLGPPTQQVQNSWDDLVGWDNDLYTERNIIFE